MKSLMSDLYPAESEFFQFVREECKEHEVSFYAGRGRRLRIECGYATGYFCDYDDTVDGPRLAIATARGTDDWFPVLVHEYAHMTQWLDDYPLWNNNKVNGKDAYDIFHDWVVEKKDIPRWMVDQAFANIIELERDCDKRAVKLIEKFKLPIDLKLYKQQSNAYHYYYHVVRECRQWHSSTNNMYKDKKVLSKFPTHFRNDPRWIIGEDQYEAILKCIDKTFKYE